MRALKLLKALAMVGAFFCVWGPEWLDRPWILGLGRVLLNNRMEKSLELTWQ